MNIADVLKKPLGLVLFGVMFAPVAMAKTGEPPDSAAAQRGQPLFQQYCVSCHGARGVGEQPVPWSLQRPDYFTRSEERRVGKECRSRWSPDH